MKEVLFFFVCIVFSVAISMLLIEHARNEKFYDCLRAGESAETCRSVL